MKKIAVICLFLLALSCQKAQETATENNQNVAVQTTQAKKEMPKNQTSQMADVPKLANKSADEFDKIFGKAAETKPIANGGEYRLYKTSNYQKGLAIRFFGGKAKSFNLILEKPVATSKEAIKQNFGIDVGNVAPIKDAKEPLSEIFKGTFGNVKFVKVLAKRKDSGNGFIFVLAEVE